MISTFPEFKKLHFSDFDDIKKVIEQLPPYSDFNLTSLFCFNVNESFEVSNLNSNLVFKITDYITNKPFYTFIGSNALTESLSTIFSYVTKDGFLELRLIPESVVENLSTEVLAEYDIVEDYANHDYILKTADLVSLEVGTNGSKKRYVEVYKKNYPDHIVKLLDLSNERVKKDVKHLLEIWRLKKQLSNENVEIEFRAINRLLENATSFDLINLGVYKEDLLLGFTVNEIVHQGYYMGHFGKTHPDYKGLGYFLESETAKVMQSKGCLYMNYEQDLGINGLKLSKQSWHPKCLLKKYTIRCKKQFDTLGGS